MASSKLASVFSGNAADAYNDDPGTVRPVRVSAGPIYSVSTRAHWHTGRGKEEMQLTPRWPQHWGSFSDELEGRVSLSDIGVVVVMVEMVVERGRKQEEDGGRTCNRQSRESGPTKRSGPGHI